MGPFLSVILLMDWSISQQTNIKELGAFRETLSPQGTTCHVKAASE